MDGRCLLLDVCVMHPRPSAQARARLLDVAQEARVVLEAVVEPVVLALEPDQDTGRLAVARDDDLLSFCPAQVFSTPTVWPLPISGS